VGGPIPLENARRFLVPLERGTVWEVAADVRYQVGGRVPLETDPTEAPLIRLPVTPDQQNGLRGASSLMVDKVTTMPRSELGSRVGRLSNEDMFRLGRAVVVFFGLAGR